MDDAARATDERWCDEQRARVADYLRSEGVKHRRIGDWPAWHVAPPARSRNRLTGRITTPVTVFGIYVGVAHVSGVYAWNFGMRERPKKHGWALLLLFAAIVAFVVFLLLGLHSGVKVSVANTGTTMRSVVLHVTGRSYPVGDLLPGKTIVQTVKPTGESHLEIEFAGAEGQIQRVNVDTYFEPGYGGTLSVVINDGKVVSSEDHVKVRPYPAARG